VAPKVDAVGGMLPGLERKEGDEITQGKEMKKNQKKTNNQPLNLETYRTGLEDTDSFSVIKLKMLSSDMVVEQTAKNQRNQPKKQEKSVRINNEKQSNTSDEEKQRANQRKR
jgi:hypothetical protein